MNIFSHKKESKRIYFDYAASTPVDPAVLEAMMPYLTEIYGNAGAVHSSGQLARNGVDTARAQVAELLSCQSHEIIFTASATESNNMALFGTLEAGDHLITTSIEHPAIIAPARELERRGVAVTFIDPNADGVVQVQDVINAITEETKLISVMYVNNEIGTIQPIQEIGKKLTEINKDRTQKIIFHTDAAQAVGHCPLHVDELGVDLLTLSGQKMYAPKGIGVQYIRNGTPIRPFVYGGKQEYGLRGGSVNVAGAVAMGAAAKQMIDNQSEEKRVTALRDEFEAKLIKNFPDVVIRGGAHRVGNFCHVSFPNALGENLMIQLDQADISVSAGPACTAGSTEPSPTLCAMGVGEAEISKSLRFTFGRATTQQDITDTLEVLRSVIK